MTVRRMTQQSRRQLEAAHTAQVVYYDDARGYFIELLKRDGNRLSLSSIVCSSEGPMVYPTPAAAVRAIRRVRPDLPDEEIPVLHHQPNRRSSRSSVLEDLLVAQSLADDLVRALELDSDVQDSRHAACARVLFSRLKQLESNLLEGGVELSD